MGGYVATPKFEVKRELKPGTDLGGGIWNPRQIRKGTTYQTSKKLIWHQSCIRSTLAGKKYKDLGEVQVAFKKATQDCKNKNPN